MSGNHELFHLINQLSRKLTKKLNEVLQPFGLYSAQWSVIFVLMRKGTLTQKEISNYLFVEAPPMTRTIKRLANQGYVIQEYGTDKRKKYIRLSDRAIASYPEWEKAVIRMNEDLLQSYPESARKELATLISKWLFQL